MGSRGLGEGHCQYMSQPYKNRIGWSKHIVYHSITWEQSFSGFGCVVPNIWMGSRGLGEGHCQYMSQHYKNQLGWSKHIVYHPVTWEQSFSGFGCVIPNIWMGGRGLGEGTVSIHHTFLQMSLDVEISLHKLT